MPVEQIHVCVLRALAEGERRAERAQHGLDLALLDAVTWPEYLWDFLRIAADPCGHLSCALSQPLAAPQASAAPAAGPLQVSHGSIVVQLLKTLSTFNCSLTLVAGCAPSNCYALGHFESFLYGNMEPLWVRTRCSEFDVPA